MAISMTICTNAELLNVAKDDVAEVFHAARKALDDAANEIIDCDPDSTFSAWQGGIYCRSRDGGLRRGHVFVTFDTISERDEADRLATVVYGAIGTAVMRIREGYTSED